MRDIPRVSLTALGCKVNYAEMATLSGQLAAEGFDVAMDCDHADIFVLNSCTVTSHADSVSRQRLHRIRRDNPRAHIVMTGCSVDANPARYGERGTDGRFADSVDAVINNQQKSSIANYISTIATTPARDEPGRVEWRSRYFLKVQDGCDHACTYCIVWQARGKSRSFPVEGIVNEALTAEALGYREVVLCGVDLGSYRHGDIRLPQLLDTLWAALSPDIRIRLSSINANDIDTDLISRSAHPQFCPHWHIPLQSGADAVLKRMHRGYRRAQYLKVISEIRRVQPMTEFTTDIMAAFPGETEEDHRATLQLIDEAAFIGCHIFRYSQRPGTPAAEMAQVDPETSHRRSVELRAAASRNQAERYRLAVSRPHDVIWERDNSSRGISSTYHTVELRDDVAAGAVRSTVHIIGHTTEKLIGRLTAHE